MTTVPRTRIGLLFVAFALLPLLVLPFLFVGCGPTPDPWTGQPGSPRVVVSFAPLECFVRNVGGDDVAVLSIVTTGGPHHADPPADEANKLRTADLLLANGLELDDEFVDKLANAGRRGRPQDRGPLVVVKLGDRMLDDKPTLVFKEEKNEGHKEENAHNHKHGEEHEHGEYDPHIWLGIPQAIRMVEIIRDELKSVDKNRAADYDRRAAEYIDHLKKLHADGKAMLKDKKHPGIVTTHDSCEYFAASFGLTIEGVLQAAPGVDSDMAGFSDLVKKCKEKNVRVIATEPQYTQQQGAAESLAKELAKRGVPDPQIVELDPLETVSGGEKLDRGWYERRMRANMETLAKALRSSRNLLTIHDVRVRFGDKDVLKGVSAGVERGKITALIGLNGSGKTTLLRAVLKETPYTGTITFHCGHDHSHPTPQHVGYVPQKLSIDATLPLTVCDLLAMALQRRPLFLGVSKKTRGEIATMLNRVDLPQSIANNFVAKLSGGEFQRVLLALALQPHPELLLLDEPAAGVDFGYQEKLYELLARLNHETGVTILLVSHDTSVVSRHADHVLCLKDGRIQCQGPPREVLTGETLMMIFGSDKVEFAHGH